MFPGPSNAPEYDGWLTQSLEETLSAPTHDSAKPFDRMVHVLAKDLADVPAERMPDTIAQWLGRTGMWYGLTGLKLARLGPKGTLEEIHGWSQGDQALRVFSRQLPYLFSQLRSGSLLVADDLSRLPPEASGDCDVLKSLGIQGILAIPFRVADDRFSIVAVRASQRPWTASILYELTVVGKFLAGAARRGMLERSWRSSEGELNAVLTAMPGMAAIVDHSSKIVRANLRWRSRVRRGFHLFRNARVGSHLLEVLAEEEAHSNSQAGQLRQGLVSVLHRERSGFSSSYHCDSSNGNGADHHYHSRISQVAEPDGGAIVVFTETEEPDDTLKAVRQYSDIAHMQRVATISDLASSIVHELSQPLAAILSNAQAARRLLERPEPDIDAVREMVNDIASTDRRAGDLLHRIHSFLRKGEVSMISLSLNNLVSDVMRLAGATARMAGADVALRLDPEIPPVWADPIQLEQVLLNLVVNALDAMNASPVRKLTVRTSRRNGAVLLAVSDTGHGIPADHLKDVFKAFYTTKEHGLGMGLAIARTIVLAHGGRLRASNNRSGGATMSITLPAVQS